MINVRQFCEPSVGVFESGSSQFQGIGDKTLCLAFLFRVGVSLMIAGAISREALIGPFDGSTTRFTSKGSTWLNRVRHVCKFLLGGDGRCSGTSA